MARMAVSALSGRDGIRDSISSSRPDIPMSEQENKNDISSAQAVSLLFRMNLDSYKIFSKIDKLSGIRAAPDAEKVTGKTGPAPGF